MEKLELKHIAKYLPYGLKTIDEEAKEVSEVVTKHSTFDWHTVGINYLIDDKSYNVKHIPILRSPDLTKPITHKGETFVPIVELAKFAFVFENTNFSLAYNNENTSGICFTINMGKNTMVFAYTDEKGFGIHQRPSNEWVFVNNQELLFEKLAEWMFDTRGLIKSGLAVDVETLDTNPYQ